MRHTTFIHLLLHIFTTFIMFSNIISFSIPMISIEAPELNIVPNNFSPQDRLQFLKNISLSRISQYHASNNASLDILEGEVRPKLSNFYVTRLYFGSSTHLFAPYFLLDTGDEKTWVQVDGCNPCFQVKDGNIRVQFSSTFKYMSTDDPRCNPPFVYLFGICGYISSYYGGRSVTRGPMGTDTFMFIDTRTNQPMFFQNVAFGLGLHNEGVTFGLNTGPNNEIRGLFGLAPGPRSFLNQLDSHIQGKFMYCLSSWTEPEPYSKYSTMYFGPEVNIFDHNVQRIKMFAKLKYNLYFRGISVDGKRLNIDPSVCPMDPTGTSVSGFVIDSGAPMTNLPTGAYQPLRSAIVSYFDKYNWQPVQGHGLDLCFSNVLSEGQSFPTVIFHFLNENQDGEVDWEMHRTNMFFPSQNVGGGFCMMIHEITNPKLCLFGAFQHANFKVLYDLKNEVLSFVPNRCGVHGQPPSSVV